MQTKNKLNIVRLLVSLPLLLAGMSFVTASAAVYTYSDQTGTDVTYTSISEDTSSEPDALFRAPAIVGNTMDFDPTFRAAASSSTGNSQVGTKLGKLKFSVMSLSNSYSIPGVRIAEAGDYTLVGLASATASVAVTADVDYSITHVDGVALSTAVDGMGSVAFGPSGASLPGGAGSAVGWSGVLNVDIAGLAAANGLTGNVTKVEFAIDNLLTVNAANGGSGGIAKKDFNVTIVPEPAGLAPFAFGALMLLMRRRRRS